MSEFFASIAPSAAAPASAPEKPVHAPARVVPPEAEPPRRNWRLIAIVAVVVLAVGAGLWYQRARRSATSSAASVRTAIAERRDLVRTIRVTGTVEATQSYVVAAPSMTGGGFGTLVITKLARSGARVKAGDVLVVFDAQNQVQTALDREADYKDFVEQIRKKQADQAAQRAKDETELKQADDAEKAAELEMQRNEVLSKIDAEKNRENLEEAKAKLAALRNTFELKRRAARSDLRILEIQRDRARNAMTHAQENAKKSTIYAPSEGVVVLNTVFKNGSMGEVQEGDEVRTGVPFMQVMNPNAMQVRARVNQADVVLMRGDAPVSVRLDAYPEVMLPGRLERVAAIGNTSNFSQRVRTFTAVFSIQGTVPQLMPDLSAAVDVELQRVGGALVIPRDAIVTDRDQSYAYVKSGQRTQRQPVHVAAANETDAAIDSGLSAGEVVVRNPERQNGGAQ
jgi:multidrug efflux pump subunit AcrA (membrane-fusion protein)